MELACVVTPVESYEDITNLPDDGLVHQDVDSSSSLGDELLSDRQCLDLTENVDGHTSTRSTTQLPKGYSEITSNGVQNNFDLYLSLDKIKENRLFHFIILKQEIRPLLININKSVDDVILKVCATFGIDRAEEYSLWLPKGALLAQGNVAQTFNFGSLTNIFKTLKTVEAEEPVCHVLNGSKCLAEQFMFNRKPYIVHLSKHSPLEEIDAGDDMTDLGEEWPAFEKEDVARQREFIQCWCGIVQGDYPIQKDIAAKLTAILLKVYFSETQPPEVYSPSVVHQFLPENFTRCSEVLTQVKQFYEALEGTTQTEAIDLVIRTCRGMLTYGGLFFPVQELEVPGQFLSWKKSKRYLLGVNRQGLIKVDAFSGKVLSVKRFSDLHSGRCRDNVLHLSFRHWDPDFYARTEQATKILEVLRIYIDFTKRNNLSTQS